MKKTLLFIVLIFGILLTSCGRNSNHDQPIDSNVTISNDVQQEFTVKENEKIKHIFPLAQGSCHLPPKLV